MVKKGNVREGEIAGLIGKNEGGKSILLRCIFRIYKKEIGRSKEGLCLYEVHLNVENEN